MREISAFERDYAMTDHGISRIDDIQDVSTQRRNFPSTHMIFGAAQTINSAMFHINEATSLALCFGGPAAVQIVIGMHLGITISLSHADFMLEQLSVLYLGQGYDINNSQSMSCPSFEQYVQTIDGSKERRHASHRGTALLINVYQRPEACLNSTLDCFC